MNVFIVTRGQYADKRIAAIFSERAPAVALVDLMNTTKEGEYFCLSLDYHEMIEYVVDDGQGIEISRYTTQDKETEVTDA